MRRWTPVVAGAVLALAGMGMTASAAHAAEHTSTTAVTRADWSAGPVQRGTGYARPGGSRRVRELQRELRRSGVDPGPVDGLYGPRTERAVRRFQHRRDLRTDAIVGPRTLHALRSVATHTAPVAMPRPAPPPLPTALPAPRAAPGSAPARPELPIAPLLAALAVLGLAGIAAGYVRTGARIRPREPAR